MEKFTKILETIDGYVWGIPLIVLIMAVGIFLTFRLRLLQIFHLPKALKFMFQNENGGKGEISSFAALCTALSATIGTGNIVGVVTAIGVLSGGPEARPLDVDSGTPWYGDKVFRGFSCYQIQTHGR